MDLKSRLRNLASPEPGGFDFPRPSYETFDDEERFRDALSYQKFSTSLVTADCLSNVTLDGSINGEGDLRFTSEAFGQLCHHARLPSSWVRQLARRNEDLALQVVQDAIEGPFDRATKRLLVDSTTRQVQAVLSEDQTYVPNFDVLDLALSATVEELRLNRAYLEGPSARMTIVNPEAPLEPQVGDVIHVGTDLHTYPGRRRLAVLNPYNERLQCENGMVARDKLSTRYVDSDGEDVEEELCRLIVQTANAAKDFLEPMQEACELFMGPDEIRTIAEFLVNDRSGGATLCREVVEHAQVEARRAGRDGETLYLWDFVNGVTHAAKQSSSINRRTELESLGYRAMQRLLN